MSVLAERYTALQAQITQAAQEAGRSPSAVTLVAATKTRSRAEIQAAIACGITVCGENRVQELCEKLDEFSYDGARVHFIGRLQTNKVKDLVGRVDCIESVDSVRLLEAIASRAEKLQLVQDVMIQVNLAGELQKGGVSPEELPVLLRLVDSCAAVRLVGLMNVAPFPQFVGSNVENFQKMRHLFVDIIPKIVNNKNSISCLSMGMSADFADAIRCGATHIRVGTALFGDRS